MKPTEKSYRFCLEPDAPIATLEQVLAIVRRLDLDLQALRTTATPRMPSHRDYVQPAPSFEAARSMAADVAANVSA